MHVKVTRPDGQLVWECMVHDVQEGFQVTIDRLGRLYLPNADGPVLPPYRVEVEDEEEQQ